MANPIFHIPPLDREAYFELEQELGERHELIDGVAYAMVGGTWSHNSVISNLHVLIANAASGGPCRVVSQGMKLRVANDLSENFFYPDVMLCCDPTDDARLWRERPTFLAEVMSSPMDRTDRVEKKNAYTALESLSEYVLVGSTWAEAIIYRRSNGWQPFPANLNRGERLESLDATLTFAGLYDGVRF